MSWSAGIWLPCPTCTAGKAFVGLDARHCVAVGCANCGAVMPVVDAAAFGLTAADVRRVLRPDYGGYGDSPSAPRGRPARVGPIYRKHVAPRGPRSDDLPAVQVSTRGAA